MMAAQNDPNIPESLHTPWQPEHLSSKFHRKSKFLMKSNVNVETSDRRGTTTPSTNSESSVPPLGLQQSPSEMTVPVAGLDIQPIKHPPSVALHTKAKILGNAKNPQQSKQAVDRSSITPLMEIIPSLLSERPQATPLNSTTSLSSSDNSFASTPELQSLTEIQHTPLTESQIDDAKGLVLDLLGWGVDPEYLVTSGVHPELIYRIFTDLNLRLPTNLVLFDDG